MLRNILSVFVGVLFGALVVFVIEMAGHVLFPPPTDIDLKDPAQLRAAMAQIPVGAHFVVENGAALASDLPKLEPRLADGGMLWVSWPKRTSKLYVDLSEDGIRRICLPMGLVDVKVCAVDQDWSGLKLMRRKSR